MSVEDLLRALQVFDPLSIFPSIDTPYSKYSTSNYTASNMEIPPMRDIVTKCQEDLKVIGTILKQIKSTVRKLSHKRKQIVSSMKMHKGFMSCIRRLPSDVLSHIFMQCLPNRTYLTPHIRHAPLLLTQICRGWREVALGTPRLWCSLSIADISRDREGLHSLYKHWLGNSGHCPLSFHISLTVSNPQFLRDFSRLYTSRWTALSITSESADGLDLLLADVPNLERLDIQAPSPSISVTQSRPRLHTLVMASPAFPTQTSAFFNSGWPNLTRLVVSFGKDPQPVNNTIFLTLLQTCPNLEIFVFSPVFIHSPDNPITLTHSKLRVLAIERGTRSTVSPLHTLIFPNLRRLLVDSQDISAIFDGISTPEGSLPDGRRIVDMTFEDFYPWSSTPAHALFTLFNPGWTGLTCLRLDVRSCTLCCLMPLQFCPQLEDLAVSMSDMIGGDHYTPPAHHILSSLALRVNHGGSIDILLKALTLPSLRHLVLTIGFADWPHTSFKEFFSQSNCPLETLEIHAENVSELGREEFTSLIPTLSQLDLHDAPHPW